MSIVFENVTKTFKGADVLCDVSFSLNSPGIYILRGASGSGKTTLLRLIAALDTPSSGAVIRKTDAVSYAFQEARLFSQLSVRANVLAVRPHHPVEEILTALHLTEAADKMPHELSGGMKKRADLARALSVKADIYLLDEPTTGQDAANAKRIAAAILKYTLGAVVVVSTHDESLGEALHSKKITVQDGQVTVSD